MTTSDDARRSLSGESISRLQGRLLVLLERHGPMTDEEIIDALALEVSDTDSSIRTRRSELVEMGKVAANGETRPSRSGRAMNVWALTRVSPVREEAFSPQELPDSKIESSMVANPMPGRPDRYVNMDMARALGADHHRRAESERAEKSRRDILEEKRELPWLEKPPRVDFGDDICRSCKGSGGNQADGPCALCDGQGVHRRG